MPYTQIDTEGDIYGHMELFDQLDNQNTELPGPGTYEINQKNSFNLK